MSRLWKWEWKWEWNLKWKLRSEPSRLCRTGCGRKMEGKYVFGNVNLTRSPIAGWMCIHGIQYEKVVMYLLHIRVSLT
jgi:hypothetical protein